jgi:hypothetical protein
MVLAAGPAWGATALPEPHSSCLSEPDRVSVEGQVEAELTVVNNTDATFQLYWLDYDGERVFYQEAPPHSSQVQATWLTHPWILTNPQEECYLLIVMTSIAQTMTIGSTTGEIPVTPVDSVPDTTAAATDTTESTGSTPDSTIVVVQPVSESGSGFPTALVIGALAMMGVLVGVLFGKGVFTGKGTGKSKKAP